MAGPPSLLERIAASYITSLATSPQQTKAISSCLLAFSGNLTGQLIRKQPISLRASVTMGGWGFLIGFALHRWYGFLARVGSGNNTFSDFLLRLFIDQVFFVPFLVALLIVYLSICQKEDTGKKLKSDWLRMVKLSWKIWPFIQFVNLRYIPPEFQPLFSNCGAFIYNVLLAMMTAQQQPTKPKVN